ncbi:lysophospholipid acyltransferase family protein [Geitlerinema splendidum]|nr:lysophospholipid acyltransferase family protein [Geitlerinema splendidum]
MKLFKKIRGSSFIRRVAGFLIAQYVRLIWFTNKWELQERGYPAPSWSEGKPLIACFWHGRLLMLFKGWYGSHKLHMLISSHPDGEIIARTTQNFGFGWIAGSSTRGGRQALFNIIKVLKKGESVGITPDGPRGPRYQASLGVIQIARLGKAAIMPLTYSSTHGFFMKSWDRFFIPLPFGKGIIRYGPLIEVNDPTKSDEDIRVELEKSLRKITYEADLECGHGEKGMKIA